MCGGGDGHCEEQRVCVCRETAIVKSRGCLCGETAIVKSRGCVCGETATVKSRGGVCRGDVHACFSEGRHTHMLLRKM